MVAGVTLSSKDRSATSDVCSCKSTTNFNKRVLENIRTAATMYDRKVQISSRGKTSYHQENEGQTEKKEAMPGRVGEGNLQGRMRK